MPELFTSGLVVFGGGVLACLALGTIVDLEDLGVGVSILSNTKGLCLWLLGGLGLGLSSECGLGGVSWKFFTALLSDGLILAEGNCLSNQFHHHGNPPDRISERGV